MRPNNQQAGATGLVYDGVDLTATFQIVSMDVPALPTIEAVTHGIAQRAGEYFAMRRVGTREIRAKLRLDAESRDPMAIFKAWRGVSSQISKSEPKKLYLNDTDYCWAVFVGESFIEDEAYYGVVELTFMCYDPYFYGEEHETSVTAGYTKTVSVDGEETYPTVELTASSATVSVENVTTGETVTVTGRSVGDVLVFDMERQQVTCEGAFVPVSLASDFFSIGPGSTKVKPTGGSGTLTYQERSL